MKTMAILGCGDFLRWQAESIQRSKQVKVTHLFDPDRSRAQGYAGIFDAKVAESAAAVQPARAQRARAPRNRLSPLPR